MKLKKKKIEKLKAVYIGVDGEAVKIWERERGIIHPELFKRYADTIRRYMLRLIEKNRKAGAGTPEE